MLDAWQRPITLSAADEHFTLRSSGPDRMSGNADDIVIEDGYVIQGGPQPPD
ncbi:MAG: hypothetical protein O7A98_00315 [Acidobacteria bacterium]|nr:hypothetical protein [Acidobacteriota bacterium]